MKNFLCTAGVRIGQAVAMLVMTPVFTLFTAAICLAAVAMILVGKADMRFSEDLRADARSE